jgi:hypothetical protein
MLWDGNECGKHQCDENLKETVLNTDYGRSKTTIESVTFQINL